MPAVRCSLPLHCAVALLLGGAAALPAQVEQDFRRLLGQAVALRLEGSPAARAAAAARARGLLAEAQALIPQLPARRRDQAAFFVGVRRVQLEWDLGLEESVASAAQLGQQVRAAARAAGVYGTYYRTQLLVLLWRSMPELAFRQLLDDGAGDREYLYAESTLAALARTGGGLKYLLRILRADLQLDDKPVAAVEQLRQLGGELQHAAEPGAKTLRDECHSRLAWHALELRDYQRAQLYLDLLPRDRTRYPRAVIAYRRGDYAFAAAEAARLCALRPEHAGFLLWANATEALAWEARRAGEPDAQLFAQALQRYRRAAALAKGPVRVAAARNGEGDCLLATGELAAAAEVLERALAGLENAQLPSARVERAECHKDLGRVAERRGAPQRAAEQYRKALDLVEGLRREIPYDLLGITWLEAGPGLLEAVDGLLRLAERAGSSLGSSAESTALLEAFCMVDRMKARGLLDWMTRPPQPADLDGYRGSLRRVLRSQDFASLRDRQLALDSLRRVESARQAPALLDLAQMDGLFAALGDALVLSYWMGNGHEDSQVRLLVADAGRPVALLKLGPAAEIQRLLVAARQAVADPRTVAWPALDAAAEALLPKELWPRLAAGRTVCCSPDGSLGWIPFAALRVEGEALGLRCRLVQVPSMAVLAQQQRRAGTAAWTLLLDSVPEDPELASLYGLTPLSFGAEEARVVAAAWPGLQRLSGPRASLAALRSALAAEQGAGLLHINSHAVRDTRLPSASLLLLADGAADMGSLAQLPLRGGCVVFSACSSAGIYSQGGEGLKGLLWGALGAGAQAVVASQWPVNQQATKDLMGQFHAGLARGLGLAEAMRQARRRLAAADNYRHPAYWAGFSVYGMPQQELSPGRRSLADWGWWLLCGLGLLSLWFGLRRRPRASLPGQQVQVGGGARRARDQGPAAGEG